MSKQNLEFCWLSKLELSNTNAIRFVVIVWPSEKSNIVSSYALTGLAFLAGPAGLGFFSAVELFSW